MKDDYHEPDSKEHNDVADDESNEENTLDELASLPLRAGAAAIDFAIIAVVLVPVLIAVGTADLIVEAVQQTEEPETPGFLASNKNVLLGFGVFYLLNGLFLARAGQTIGKKILGTRIVSTKDGNIPDALPLIGKRYLALQVLSLIPYLGILVVIADIGFIFRKGRQRLSDRLANTKVIKVVPEEFTLEED